MVFTDEDNDDVDASAAKTKASSKYSVQISKSRPSLFSNDVEAQDCHPDENTGRSRKRIKPTYSEPERLRWSSGESEDVGTKGNMKSKTHPTQARKRAAATSRKARTVDVDDISFPSSNASGKTGVGRHVSRKRKQRKVQSFDDEEPDVNVGVEDFLPDYVQERRAKFNDRTERLKEAGLMLPPAYDDMYFSDDDRLRDLKEKPNFTTIKPISTYKDIEMPYSLGIIPASIAQYLREYQVKGAAFLHELFVYQKGGILGDDMGLGKTIQVIAFLTAAYGKTGDERDQKRMRKMRRTRKWYPRTLIICPGSLMANWQEEFNRWGWWQTDIFHGPADQKQSILDAAKSGMLEVMITTYATYRLNKSAINTIAWDCVVADECHIIKERRAEITKCMNEVNSICRIGLTGTAIQNKYEELWTLLNWTSPGTFGTMSEWKRTISEPLKLGQSHNATLYELAQSRKTAKKLVENLLPQFFLRRMKTLIRDQLPKKTDRVVFCPLTSAQADAYMNFLEGDAIKTIRESSDPCDCGSKKRKGWCCHTKLENGDAWQAWVFPCIAYLQRLCNHLALLVPSGNDTKEKQDKDLDMLQIAVPDSWKKLYETRDSVINYSNPDFCGKWRVLRKLLKFWYDQGDNKVLVFSHSVKLLRMLQSLFIHTNYNVMFLDGSMTYDERYVAVRDFNTDPTQFVFLISTKAGGVGLNITSANKVVVVDPNWNPSYDLQAQDRAYRIGQTRDVEVFRLVSQGTLEEVVYARQIYKQQQASIGYNASSERRYFQGVQDRKDQKGEIFGLQNLFAYQDENVVLRDIVHKTNVAESKADVRIANLDLQDQTSEDDSDIDSDAGKSKFKTEDDDEAITNDSQARSRKADSAMSQLAAEITGELDEADLKLSRKTKASHKNKLAGTGKRLPTSFTSDASSRESRSDRRDPIQAILASAGVSYTHENSEVIGSSRVEAELSKRAEMAKGNQQQHRVFKADSQSKQQASKSRSSSSHREGQNIGENQENELEFRYKYRPPEHVKRRLFCSMARWAGYCQQDDPAKDEITRETDKTTHVRGVIDFALVVESWTAAERREFLEKWYAWRRDRLIHGGASYSSIVDHEDEVDFDTDPAAREEEEEEEEDEVENDLGSSQLIKQEEKSPQTDDDMNDDVILGEGPATRQKGTDAKQEPVNEDTTVLTINDGDGDDDEDEDDEL